MIAAVVVTYSAPAAVLDRCLRALHAEAGLDRIVVVDTGGSATIEPDLAARVELVRMTNRGYGAAANHGFGLTDDAEVTVLLNDDVVAQPGWLPPLLTEFTAGIGAVQPAIVAADHSIVTSLGVHLDRYGAGSDVGDGGTLPTDRSACDLEILNGATVAFGRDFIHDTGGFDERYFLYYEDVDLSLRGRESGWRYRLAPEAVVEHRRGTSTGTDVEGTLFHQERNRLWAAFRFGSPGLVMRATWLSVRRLRHEPRSLHRRALLAGLAGAPRALVDRVRAPGRRTARR